jgi:8-oxo-dGTP diphosphatase
MHVTAAIIENDGKVLITQRGADDECPLLWEFPGGKLEEGETLEACIVREIKEELDLDISLNGIFTTSIYRYDGKDIHFTVFKACVAAGKIELNVHNDARWVEIRDLKKYNFMPADVEFADKLIRENG